MRWYIFSGRIRSVLTADSTTTELFASFPAFVWATAILCQPGLFTESRGLANFAWIDEKCMAYMLYSYFCLCLMGWLAQNYLIRKLMMIFGVGIWVAISTELVTKTPILGWVELLNAFAALLAYARLTILRSPCEGNVK